MQIYQGFQILVESPSSRKFPTTAIRAALKQYPGASIVIRIAPTRKKPAVVSIEPPPDFNFGTFIGAGGRNPATSEAMQRSVQWHLSRIQAAA